MAKTHSKHFTIYLVTNQVNGKYYVGQTTTTIAARWRMHKCHARLLSRRLYGHLPPAIRKHGAEAFLIETLATTDSIEKLNDLEQLWILVLDAQNPRVGYNCDGGGRNRLVSAETRAKMSAAFRGRTVSAATRAKLSNRVVSAETRAKCGAFFRGRPLTPEHRAKVGRPGVPKSAEHRERIRQALKGRRPSPQAIAAVAYANTQRVMSPETKAKLKAAAAKANLGRVVSAETRAKLSAAIKARPPWPRTARGTFERTGT